MNHDLKPQLPGERMDLSENAWGRMVEAAALAMGSMSLAEHAKIQREVTALVEGGCLPDSVRTLRLAIVRSMTIEPVLSSVVTAMATRNFAVSIQLGQLGNHVQELFAEDSFVYSGRCDVCIVLVSLESILPGILDPAIEFSDVPGVMDFFLQGLDRLAGRFTGLIIVSNFTMAPNVPARHFQSQHPTSSRYVVDEANRLLASWAEGRKQVRICDTACVLQQIGAERFYSQRNMMMAMQPFDVEGFGRIAGEWSDLCRLHYRGAAKCIVLDCDQTLWGGVIGEDGLHGIRLGETYPGICFQQFQRQLKGLKELGFLLAINSKNNADDVRAVFEQHPGSVLRYEDFAAVRANWQDKATNMKSLAEELNLGVDSFVFVDDSLFEIELVRRSCAGVLCLQVPSEVWRLPSLLSGVPQLDRLALTDEDRQKSAMYAEERKRNIVREAVGSIDEFLDRLDLEMTIDPFDRQQHLERAVQLIQKTNQFNLTTRRHSDSRLITMIAEGAEVFIASLRDRFGDYGRIALAVITTGPDGTPSLDTFLMSCRAIGRKAETAFLAFLARRLQSAGHDRLLAEFIPSSKNRVSAGFLPSHGFRLLCRSEDGKETYAAALADIPTDTDKLYQVSFSGNTTGASHE